MHGHGCRLHRTGFAPTKPTRGLDDPSLRAARAAVSRLLDAHEPFPALAVDRGWTLVAANQALTPLIASAAPWLATPPVNVLRLSLHPEGLAPRIENLAQWGGHLLHRLRRQILETGDETLKELHHELSSYPSPPPDTRHAGAEDIVAVSLRLRTAAGVLAFWSTTLVFGAPLDVTISELALETFLPADEATAAALTRAVDGRRAAADAAFSAGDSGLQSSAP